MEIPETGTAAVKPQYAPVNTSARKNQSASTTSEADEVQQLSPRAPLVYTHDLEEFNFSRDQTQYAYYSQDHNVALRARSQLNIQSRQETYSFDLTFSAEALGRTAKDFEAAGGKPIEFSFTMLQERLQAQQIETSKVVKTLRKPTDILLDLAEALQTVMRDRGNKSVSYVLDQEAREALMGDSKIVEALGQLATLMAMINLMKSRNEPSNDYTIYVSGKGKPYLDHERQTDVTHEMVSVEFHMTILPPGAGMPELQPSSNGSVEGDIQAAPAVV